MSPAHRSDLLRVQGDGGTTSYWRSRTIRPNPGSLYALSFEMRGDAQGGAAIAGLNVANRDFGVPSGWRPFRFILRVPDEAAGAFLRVGQWQAHGAIDYRDVHMAPVTPIERTIGNLALGAGESVAGRVYTMAAQLSGEGSNYSRTLERATAGFNTDRWTFGPDAEVIYGCRVRAARQTAGVVSVNVNYHVAGACVVEASAGGPWVEVGRLTRVSSGAFPLPSTLLPARKVRIRLRADGPAEFQVNGLRYEARLDRSLPPAEGWTRYLEVTKPSRAVKVTVIDPGPLRPAPDSALRLRVERQPGSEAAQLTVVLRTNEGGPVEPRLASPRSRPSNGGGRIAGRGRVIRIPYCIRRAGPGTMRIALYSRAGLLWEGRMDYSVPDLQAADYGWRLPSSDDVDLWTCENVRKVSRDRPLPDASAPAIALEAARGGEEAAQLVIHPRAALHGLTARVSDLVGPHDARIAHSQIEVWRVGYVPVQTPTDSAGAAGEWPDPLPPLTGPIDLEAGRNQPLWITVRVPAGIPAGLYRGTVHLAARGWDHAAPIHLTVWDVTLPRTFTITSALGFSPGLLRAYHHLETDEELERVADLYYRNFARHHLSPYNPMELAPIGVEERDGDVALDFTAFDRAAKRYLDDLGFTTFQLPIEGMGGGTFFERHPGRFLGHDEGTPEYDRLFTSYLRRLQDHLEAHGWLEKAYLYWFDEPAEKDFDFVKAGMEGLHRAAPKLARMLTAQPETALDGAVDVWCPILDRYRPDAAHAEQREGRRIWWYVCTGPKAPYTTLFIDHPATSLRAWVWLTYQYRVNGLLVWSTNYWTSPTAFPPPALQDPYRDPMSYVSGYGVPPGTRSYWGNGDGRFLYPPEGYEDGKKRIEGPVNSIRWEMLREGLEDTELFFALKKAIAVARERGAPEVQLQEAERLLRVPATVARDPADFNADPRPLLLHRRKVAHMIEALRK